MVNARIDKNPNELKKASNVDCCVSVIRAMNKARELANNTKIILLSELLVKIKTSIRIIETIPIIFINIMHLLYFRMLKKLKFLLL